MTKVTVDIEAFDSLVRIAEAFAAPKAPPALAEFIESQRAAINAARLSDFLAREAKRLAKLAEADENIAHAAAVAAGRVPDEDGVYHR